MIESNNPEINISGLSSTQKNFEDFADIFSALQLLGIDADDFVNIMDEIDDLPDYLWIHDENHRIVYGNRSFLGNFSSCMKQTCYQCLMGEKDVCKCCLSKETLTHEKTKRCTLCKRNDAGYDINIFHTPIKNNDGRKFIITSSFHIEKTSNLTKRLKIKETPETDETLLLVMCSSCNRMKDRDDHWGGIEKTTIDNSNIRISHGICPECRKILYSNLL